MAPVSPKPARDHGISAPASPLSSLKGLCCFSRSSHLPLFVQMSPLCSDWSHAGLKGLIPSVLHYSLLGYNFFIPDAVGKDFPFPLPISGFSAVSFAAFFQAREVYLHLRCAVGRLGAFCSPVFCCAGLIGMNVTREKSEELKPKEYACKYCHALPRVPPHPTPVGLGLG